MIEKELSEILNTFLDYAMFNWKAKLYSTKYTGEASTPLSDGDIDALIRGFIEDRPTPQPAPSS